MLKLKNLRYVLLICISALLGYAYYGLYSDKVFAVVEGKFYRSAQLEPEKLVRVMSDYRIKSVINLRGDGSNAAWFQKEIATVKKAGIDYVNLSLPPNELPSYEKLNALVSALNSSSLPVLFHCKHGVDRTGLAAAISLILAGITDRETIEKQISARYGVVPFSDSVGVLVFDQFFDWLDEKGEEVTKKVFLNWVKNEYIDADGNMRFYIDRVGNTAFKYDSSEDLSTATVFLHREKDLIIHGWAYDVREHAPVDAIRMIVGSQEAVNLLYETKRGDILKYFNLNGKMDPVIGFTAKIKTENLASGIHPIKLSNRHKTVRKNLGSEFALEIKR